MIEATLNFTLEDIFFSVCSPFYLSQFIYWLPSGFFCILLMYIFPFQFTVSKIFILISILFFLVGSGRFYFVFGGLKKRLIGDGLLTKSCYYYLPKFSANTKQCNKNLNLLCKLILRTNIESDLRLF